MGRCSCLTAAILLLALSHAVSARQLQAPADGPGEEFFVEIRDGQFVAGCQNFKVAGWNQWEVVEAAAGAPFLSGASIPVGFTGPQLVRELITQGAKSGMNVMRMWVHGVNPQYALQTAPGEYNEATFQGLDYVIDEARKAGIKLVLAFTSNWTPIGGLPEYVKWAGGTETTEFFTNTVAKNLYKDFVTTIVNRVNTLNGRIYRDDPTIMSWNLLNEPRCDGCPKGTVANWYDEMATFVKTLDPNHLVTTGEEGFYGTNNPANPGAAGGSDWASKTGQDFLADHASDAIDYATIHIWPDNWNDVTEKFQRTWISSHADDAAATLKKPLVVEEWGKWVNASAPDSTLADRSTVMAAAFDEVESQITKKSALQGSLFWQYYLDGQEAAPTEGGGRGLFGIYPADEAFGLVKKNAAFVQGKNTPLAGCTAAQHKAVTVGPASDCSQTWVKELPGTGMDGEACDVPINECIRGTHNCGENAACIDTVAGFDCRCYWGYSGDGTTCAPAPELASLEKLYWTQPKGQACDEGVPVAWPNYAPGFVYDPMNSLKFYQTDDKVGSPTNVTLQGCMIACQMAEACESFVYNDVQQKCFLTAKQCPTFNVCGGPETTCNSTNDRGGEFSFACGFWVSYYRLDMDTKAACDDFVPDSYVATIAQPEVIAEFEGYKAANPGRFGGAVEAAPADATAVTGAADVPAAPGVTAAAGR